MDEDPVITPKKRRATDASFSLSTAKKVVLEMDSVAENAPQFVFHVSTLFEEEDRKLDSKIEENESQRMRFISVDRNRCSMEIGGNAEDVSKPSIEPLPPLVTNEQTVIDSDLDSGPLPIQMEK